MWKFKNSLINKEILSKFFKNEMFKNCGKICYKIVNVKGVETC